MKLTVVIILLI